MATSVVKPSVLKLGPVLIPDASAVPVSFQQALKHGWKIAKEQSFYEETRKNGDVVKREGVLLLQNRKFPFNLRVPFTADCAGYAFAKPEPIES
jgi:hypothetical protein